MALDVKIINFASYLNDQGMLYSTDIKHTQILDRHSITCTIIVHPDPTVACMERRIKAIAETNYADSGIREATMDALKLAFPSQWIRHEAEVASA